MSTCEAWGCDGRGRSRQGWSANYGNQYAPCGRPCDPTPDPARVVCRDETTTTAEEAK